MSTNIYNFGEYSIVFVIYSDNTLCIQYCDPDELIFEIYDEVIEIFNFSITMSFFGLSNLCEVSDAIINECQNYTRYNFKIFNELADYAATDKLKEIADTLKLEEQTDIKDQKMYEALKSLFPEQVDNSIRLVFVD